MTQTLLIMLIMLSTIIFIQLNHPLTMGLMLLVQTLWICLITGLMNESYWFSYILFLVFLGGMLVLFIYVTSLASNETFTLSFNIPIMISFFITMMMFIFMNEYMTMTNLFFNNLENIQKENYTHLIKLFNYPTNLITILLMNYLLITLIAIVKITNIFYGPLRQMFN